MEPAKHTISGTLLQELTRFGRVYLLNTCSSTNDYAFTLPESGEPAIIVAQEQTQARGRFRRPWYGDRDSLTFSVLLPGQADCPFLPTITQLAGLSVCLGIEDLTGLKPLIRWPNDLLLNNKKIAGILCERKNSRLVVGIGINVNQTAFPEWLPEAGSLLQFTNKYEDKHELLLRILKHLFRLLQETAEGGQAVHLSAIKQRSAILHRRVEVKTWLRRYVGTVVDLDTEGHLVLRTDGGKVIVLNSGQVRKLR